MKAFDEAEKAKGHGRDWWPPVSDSEGDEPTRPARFHPRKDEGQAAEPERPQSQRKKIRTEGSHKGKARKKRRRKMPESPVVSPVVLVPADSAGHDDIIYVDSAGDSPKAVPPVGAEVQELIDTQQALLAEADAATKKRTQLISLLGEAEAEKYFALKAAEGKAA